MNLSRLIESEGRDGCGILFKLKMKLSCLVTGNVERLVSVCTLGWTRSFTMSFSLFTSLGVRLCPTLFGSPNRLQGTGQQPSHFDFMLKRRRKGHEKDSVPRLRSGRDSTLQSRPLITLCDPSTFSVVGGTN